jgi:hypothetical protein
LDRRAHPQTQSDFAALYNELATWRQEETQRIKVESVSLNRPLYSLFHTLSSTLSSQLDMLTLD